MDLKATLRGKKGRLRATLSLGRQNGVALTISGLVLARRSKNE